MPSRDSFETELDSASLWIFSFQILKQVIADGRKIGLTLTVVLSTINILAIRIL